MDLIDTVALSHEGSEDWTAQAEVFDEIFFVFLALGTLVGVVVVSYTLYNVYKYRDGSGNGADDDQFEPPVVGELPSGQGGKKGKKLFLSFGLSAIVVISLVVYSYGLLLYVETGPADEVTHDEEMAVEVVGYQFGWEFQYENGVTTRNELRVPADERVLLTVTSKDVWHTLGIPEKRVKADAIPGQTSETWFDTGEAGVYRAECFELCGAGHSAMNAEVIVMEPEEYEEWLAEAEQEQANENGAEDGEEVESDEETDGNEAESTDRVSAPSVLLTAVYETMDPDGPTEPFAGGNT